MKPAFYLKTKPDGVFSNDHVGGQPRRVPAIRPWPAEDNEFMGFLLQFSVDGYRLNIPGAEAIQLYQDIEAGQGADPTPKAVLVFPDAPPNSNGAIVVHPSASASRIVFEPVDDPDFFPSEEDMQTQGRLFKSKLGGLDPWGPDPGGRPFLGQIHQTLGNFNFAGMVCSLYLETDGTVSAELK